MSLSMDLLQELENSTYVSNGTQIVNIDGPRGFTAIVSTNKVWTGAPKLVFDTIKYDNDKINLSSQVKLSAEKYFIIEPSPINRILTMQITIWTGGVATPTTTSLVFEFMLPESELIQGTVPERRTTIIQHSQTTAMSKGNYSVSFLIPKNAYDFTILMGTSPYTTSLYGLRIYGILMA